MQHFGLAKMGGYNASVNLLRPPDREGLREHVAAGLSRLLVVSSETINLRFAQDSRPINHDFSKDMFDRSRGEPELLLRKLLLLHKRTPPPFLQDFQKPLENRRTTAEHEAHL